MKRLLSFGNLRSEKGHPLSRAQTHRKVRNGTFPAPIKIGTRNAWIEEEYDAYIEALRAERDARLEVA